MKAYQPSKQSIQIHCLWHSLITHRWPKHSLHSVAKNVFSWCGSALVQRIRYTGKRVSKFVYLCRQNCFKYSLKYQDLNNLFVGLHKFEILPPLSSLYLLSLVNVHATLPHHGISFMLRKYYLLWSSTVDDFNL